MLTSERLAQLDAERSAYLDGKLKRKRSRQHWLPHIEAPKVGRPFLHVPKNWDAIVSFVKANIGNYFRDDELMIVVCVADRLGLSMSPVGRALGISCQRARSLAANLWRKKHVDTRRLVEEIASKCPAPVWNAEGKVA